MSEDPQVPKRRKKTLYSFFTSTRESNKKDLEPSPSIANIENLVDDGQPHLNVLEEEVDTTSFIRDPGLRLQIWKYPINKQDELRRAYLNEGPYQPILKDYPRTKFGKQSRRFQDSWYTLFPWLEYSPTKDAAYCLPCFIFETNPPKRTSFTDQGFRRWKSVNDGTKCAFLTYMGDHNSQHMLAVKACQDLGWTSRHIDKMINVQSKELVKKNRRRLMASIDCLRYLAYQTCAFRGHDESTNSSNRGNFIELVKLLAKNNDEIQQVVLENTPQNAKYTSPSIQKEILSILANKVRNKIREEVGSSKFCILVDEAQDDSQKEQMAIVLRFVDDGGSIKERFFDIVHVKNTASLTLKQAITNVFIRNDLHTENMRGQGYDGTSNMRGAFNGLQALFLRDCPYAYYVHCFAHRLQLALVGACKDVNAIYRFYSTLNATINFLCASPLRQDELKSFRVNEIVSLLEDDELETGKGLNQVGNLQRPGATRWSSHLNSVKSLIDMFSATCGVLRNLMKTAPTNILRIESEGLFIAVTTFEFVFILHLMCKIMEITDLLCQALQKKSQDIVNAMRLVKSTKSLLKELRQDGWDAFIKQVEAFCNKNDVIIPDMSDPYVVGSLRSCRQQDNITMAHHYHIDLFNAAIDFQLEELNTRFTDETIELLILSSTLDPTDAFRSFKIDDICLLAEKYYPKDFSKQDIIGLRCQLLHYEHDVLHHPEFQNLATISELCKKLVETRKSKSYCLIYRLICLVLTLPVSTATTERAFSAMKLVKTTLRSKMEDDFLRDCMIIHIEKEIAETIDSDLIIDEFYKLKDRRAQLK